QSYHVTAVCGEPSGLTVAITAGCGSRRKSWTCSGTGGLGMAREATQRSALGSARARASVLHDAEPPVPRRRRAGDGDDARATRREPVAGLEVAAPAVKHRRRPGRRLGQVLGMAGCGDVAVAEQAKVLACVRDGGAAVDVVVRAGLRDEAERESGDDGRNRDLGHPCVIAHAATPLLEACLAAT